MNEMNDPVFLAVWRRENRRSLRTIPATKQAGREHELNRQTWDALRDQLWDRHGRRLFDVRLTSNGGINE